MQATANTRILIDSVEFYRKLIKIYLAPDAGELYAVDGRTDLYSQEIANGKDLLFDRTNDVLLGEVKKTSSGVRFTSKVKDLLSFEISQRELAGESARSNVMINFFIYFVKLHGDKK